MKKIALVLLGLGVLCFGLYFAIGSKFGDLKVTFDSNGGTFVREQTVKKGEKATVPENPVKENGSFIEWQLDGKAYDFNTPVTSNITLTALWNDFIPRNVKITIDSNEYTTQFHDGDVLSIESFGIPVKEGYRIALYNEDGTDYDMTKPVTTDLNLTGKYVEIKKYKVTFNSNGGSKVNTEEVVEGSVVVEPTTTRDGYEFGGWYLNDTEYDFKTPVTKSITLKAKWTEKGKVNVIFMVDDKVYKTISVKEGTKVSKPANPTKKGYKFVEWQLDGSKFDFSTKITSETTLTATFEEVESYTVTFNSDGGSKVSSQSVEVGSKAKKPTNPTKDGYEFVEWQLNGKTYDFNKEVIMDLALKAKWQQVIKYTVTFYSQDKKVDTMEVKEGDKVNAPTVTRDGYTLDGWVNKDDHKMFDFTTPITKDLELTARWTQASVENPDIPIEESSEEEK